jgi:protoheme IX farnesyltransferase
MFAFALFAIQFLWQFPHFWAIAWLLREDYAKVGFRMLPFQGATGRQTGYCALQFSFALLPLAGVVAIGSYSHAQPWRGIVTVVLAVFLTSWLVAACYRFMKEPSNVNAKSIIRTSVLYLPALLLVLILTRP